MYYKHWHISTDLVINHVTDISTRCKPRIQLIYVTNNKILLLIINKAEREINIYYFVKVRARDWQQRLWIHWKNAKDMSNACIVDKT